MNNIVKLTYITKQHVTQYIAGTQQFKNLHPKNYNKKTWKYATYGIMDKLLLTCSYAELNFKLQNVSSFFIHHSQTTHQQPNGRNVIIVHTYILLIHAAFSVL